MNRKNLIAGFLVLLTLPGSGCGGSGGSSGSSGSSSVPAMTQAQASAAFTEVFTAMVSAEETLFLDRSNPVSMLRKEGASEIQKAILNGARIPASAGSIPPAPELSPDTTSNIPAFTYDCPSGGTIVVTGSYSETSTLESANVIETINGCKDDGVTMNGDPNITLSLAGSNNATTTSLTLTMAGGLTVGASHCSTDLNLTASVNDKTGTGTETYAGSFCGVAISGTSPI